MSGGYLVGANGAMVSHAEEATSANTTSYFISTGKDISAKQSDIPLHINAHCGL